MLWCITRYANNSALRASNLAFECNIQGQNRDCQFDTSCLTPRNRIHRKSQNKHFPGVLFIDDRPHVWTMDTNVTWRRLKMQKSDAFLNIYSANQPAINTGHIFFFTHVAYWQKSATITKPAHDMSHVGDDKN